MLVYSYYTHLFPKFIRLPLFSGPRHKGSFCSAARPRDVTSRPSRGSGRSRTAARQGTPKLKASKECPPSGHSKRSKRLRPLNWNQICMFVVHVFLFGAWLIWFNRIDFRGGFGMFLFPGRVMGVTQATYHTKQSNNVPEWVVTHLPHPGRNHVATRANATRPKIDACTPLVMVTDHNHDNPSGSIFRHTPKIFSHFIPSLSPTYSVPTTSMPTTTSSTRQHLVLHLYSPNRSGPSGSVWPLRTPAVSGSWRLEVLHRALQLVAGRAHLQAEPALCGALGSKRPAWS